MYSVQIETSDGTLTRVNLGIQYFEKNDITVYRNEAEVPLVLGTDWQWDGDSTIVLLNGAEPVGNQILVFRNTDKDRAFNIYDGGAPFSRDTLDENFKQMIYLAQEFTEGSGIAGLYRNLNMHGNRVINLGDPVDALDATNKKYVDAQDVFYDTKQSNWNTQQDAEISAIKAGLDLGKSIYTIPWVYVAVGAETSISPPYIFSAAWVWINGVMQYMTNGAYSILNNTVYLAEPLLADDEVLIAIGSDIAPPYPFPTRKKVELYWSGISLVVPTTVTNLVGLLKTVPQTSGTFTPFFNLASNKLNVFNDDATLLFKLNLVGSWSGVAANRGMKLVFDGTSGNTVVVNGIQADTPPDTLQFTTYLSVDKDGNLATNGSAITLQSLVSNFTITAALLTVEQVTTLNSITSI